MAFSQESSAVSASTNAPTARTYDGGTVTVVGGDHKVTVNIAQTASGADANGVAGVYRIKVATSAAGPWTIAGTVPANRAGGGSNAYLAATYDATGLTASTLYYVTVALDNQP